MRRLPLILLSVLALVSPLLAQPPALAADLTPVTITIETDRPVLTAEQPTAQITGRVTAQRPREEPHPLAGRTVHLRNEYGNPIAADATTDADGRYTVTYQPVSLSGSVAAEVDPSGEYAGARSGTLAFEVRQSATRVSVAADRTKADDGQQFKFNGLVEWQSSTGWRPLAGANVEIRLPHSCSANHLWVNTVTGATGHYQAKLTPRCDTSVYATATHPRLYYSQSQVRLGATLDIRPRVQISLGATLDPYGEVNIGGSMYTRSPHTSRNYAGQPIHIEYSPNGRTNWRRHRTIRFKDNGFTTKFRVTYSGYWRARYAGGPEGMPGVSPVRKLWRWGTRMSKIKISPKRVRKNGFVTAKGTLTRYYKVTQRKPTAFANQNVRIIFRFRGKKTWYHLGWDKTDRKGRFTKRVRAYGDGFYAAIYHGSKTTWAVGSPNTVYVDTYGGSSYATVPPLGPVVAAPPALPGHAGPADAALTP